MSDSLATNIFADLDISTKGFLDSKEDAIAFSKRVLAAAKELEDIMDTKQTVSSVETEAEKTYRNSDTFQQEYRELFDEALATMYESCEEIPLPVVYGLIEGLEKLTKDLRNTLHDRAKRESIAQSANQANKKLAQTQHSRLRENYENVVKMVGMLYNVELERIKPKRGNYSAPSMTDTYAYIFNGEEEPYYNPKAVAKRLGIYYPDIKFMDIMEYCEKHPDLISVVKVEL